MLDVDAFNLSGPERFLRWFELAEKYLDPQPNELLYLADRILRARAQLKNEPPVDGRGIHKFPKLWPAISANWAADAQKLKRELHTASAKALLHGDSRFLQRFCDACALIGKGPLSRPIDAPGAAVYAYLHLFLEQKHIPTRRAVQELVNRWFKEGGKKPVSARRWRQIMQEMEPLFESLPSAESKLLSR